MPCHLPKRCGPDDTVRFDTIEPREEPERQEETRSFKIKRFGLKPMSPEEASLQMELLGHNFFVYRDAETDGIHVIYKRKDGDYGVIEAE